jgi:peptide/nickel transport system substrate-binding protein
VEFAVLGRVEVRIDGQPVSLGGPKQRGLLALLLLNANEVVSRDRLIDSLWEGRAPASAQRSLDSYVSRLRTLLGGGRIERQTPGYLLRVEPNELDLERFEGLLERGRAAAATGDAMAARDLLVEALGIWRGRALADLEDEPFVAGEAERLEERRLLALEARIAAELELGGGAELVGELERLVAEHPYRERPLGQLMVCLYRAGRQADALAAYQACRRRFAEELGLEPGAELRALEQRILAQDPTLGSVRPSPAVKRARRITRAGVAAATFGVAVIAAAVIAGIDLSTGGSNLSAAFGSAGIFELDGGSSVVARSTLDAAPAAMVAYGSSIWLAEPDAGAVERVDLRTHQVMERIAVGGTPSALAAGGKSLWAASVPGAVVYRIDPATDAVTQAIHLGDARASAIAFGLGHLWVADATDEVLLEFDPKTGRRERMLHVDLHPTAIAFGADSIWAVDYDAALLARIDPRSGESIPIRVGNGPVAIAIGDSAVWVANRVDSTVSKVDPTSDSVAGTTAVGSYPVALAVDRGSVSIANEYSSSVSRIDAQRDLVVQTTLVGGAPNSLVQAAGRIWVGTRPLAVHRGGTLVLLHTSPLLADPALQVDLPPLQSNGLTNDALLGYDRGGGPQSLQLVPDLAVSIPSAGNGGTTYTFQLRPGIRYSNGRLVRAGDFRAAVERLFRVGSAWSGNYMSIVGAASCTVKRCDLRRGIVADDASGTISFHLRAPDPDFLANMTSMATAPVPAGTPMADLNFLPTLGTGPYMVASADTKEIRYVRNPRFHEWSHAAQPDGNPDVIIMRYGLSPAQEVREVERGQADWTADSVPGPLLSEVTTRFPAQWHSLLSTETDFLQLNTTIAPFNDARVRRALNLAIDRRVIVRLYGGSNEASPACQILPPGVFGYRPYCPFSGPHGADLERARRLVAASGTRGDPITVFGRSDNGTLAAAIVHSTVRVLRQLGYQAQARLVPLGYFASISPITWSSIQLIAPISNFGSTPYQFFAGFFCGTPNGHDWFCDHRLDREIRRVQAIAANDPRAASALWAKIDRELVDRGIWVPLVNPHFIDFVSKRLHDYREDPHFGLIVDQASLR